MVPKVVSNIENSKRFDGFHVIDQNIEAFLSLAAQYQIGVLISDCSYISSGVHITGVNCVQKHSQCLCHGFSLKSPCI